MTQAGALGDPYGSGLRTVWWAYGVGPVNSWARALAGAVVLLTAALIAVALVRDDADPVAERRAVVTRYLAEVNMTQQTLAAELQRVQEAYRGLRLTGRPEPGRREQVGVAVATLVDLRARVAALPSPPEADRLRALLLRLVDLQIGLAREVAGMATYLPAQGRVSRLLTAATNRLLEKLRAASTAGAQREAFGEYRRALDQVLAMLRSTTAPQVLAPVRTGELARLRRLRGLVGRIDRALEAGKPAEIDLLFRRFVQTSTDTGTTPARRRAVVAFNRRIGAITAERAKIAAEVRRLDIELR